MGSRAHLDCALLSRPLLRVDRLTGPLPVRRVRPHRQRATSLSPRGGVGVAGARGSALDLERCVHREAAAEAGRLPKDTGLRLDSDQPAGLFYLWGVNGESSYFS